MTRFISIKTVSIVAFVFLFIDWIMLMSGKGSICPTTSCQVAAEATRFGNHAMVGLGALYFLLLSLLAFLQKPDGSGLSPSLFMICLLSGMAFDGAILGFQFFNLSGKCPICWAVAMALIVIVVIHSIQKRSLSILLTGCLVWLSAFIANAAVIGYQPPPSLKETALWEYSSSNTEFPRYHLFFGIRCPHCTTVIKALNDHPLSGQWTISSIDRDSESLKRLSAIHGQIQNGPSVFGDLLAAKDDTIVTQNTVVSPLINSMTQKARRYFINNEFKGIPVMIIQTDENRRLILKGDEAILCYLGDVINHN